MVPDLRGISYVPVSRGAIIIEDAMKIKRDIVYFIFNRKHNESGSPEILLTSSERTG